ncbi:hypothetical protein BJY52DRAFT_1264392 [Lactarius psammicola]|nr:hypothetical protein BJY52DRAFT_1264392 [Lactarius psammicola]
MGRYLSPLISLRRVKYFWLLPGAVSLSGSRFTLTLRVDLAPTSPDSPYKCECSRYCKYLRPVSKSENDVFRP